MHASFLLPIWAAVALAIYKLASLVVEKRRHSGM